MPPEPTPIVRRVFPKSFQTKTLKSRRYTKPLIALGGLLCVSLITYGALAFYQQTHRAVTIVPVASITPTPSPTATPTPAAQAENILDGTMVDPSKANVHPLAVMIENHPDARPQSGLGSANLVYEAIAEGGITRFMAIYRDPSQAVRVGPVRSSRTYFLHFANEINAFYAHAGGNRDALDEIAAGGTYDLDGLSLGSPLFTRDYSRNVATEHTLYSSTDKLWQYATVTNKWPTTSSFSPWLFQDDPATDKRPASQTVNVKVSDSLYAVSWAYDPASNSYARSMAGAPHIDANTGQQIKVKNIVLETVQRQATVTKIGEEGWIYTTTGTGPAVIIQNGTAIKGTWKHDGDRTRYYDSNGQEVHFVRGTTWVQIVHSDSAISY